MQNKAVTSRAIRDGVAEGLALIGGDERVVVLSGDLAESTRVMAFGKDYPARFLEMGVQEQNIVGVAAGLASEGYIPFVSSYAAFSPGRNWEQIRVSVCMPSLNVKIIGGHGGVATGVNGPTHQATEDIALIRTLPKMTVLAPADASQCAAAVVASYHHTGPVYIRTARPQTPDFTKGQSFEIGKIYRYREGRDLTIAACGVLVWEALQVAEELAKKGVECEVLNVSTIKPLDQDTLLVSVLKTRRLLTLEDHQIAGGMGSALVEALAELGPVPTKRLGVNDRFGVSGSYEDVYRLMGFDRDSLRDQIEQWALW